MDWQLKMTIIIIKRKTRRKQKRLEISNACHLVDYICCMIVNYKIYEIRLTCLKVKDHTHLGLQKFIKMSSADIQTRKDKLFLSSCLTETLQQLHCYKLATAEKIFSDRLSTVKNNNSSVVYWKGCGEAGSWNFERTPANFSQRNTGAQTIFILSMNLPKQGI